MGNFLSVFRRTSSCVLEGASDNLVEENSFKDDNFMEIGDDHYNDGDGLQETNNEDETQNNITSPAKVKIGRRESSFCSQELASTPLLNGNRCEICNKQFRTVQFKRHMRTHNENLIKCDMYGDDFLKEELKEHILSVHPVKQEQFNCSICSKQYILKRNFVKHMKLHEFRNARAGSGSSVATEEIKSDRARVVTKRRRSSQGRKLLCPVCNLECDSRAALNHHKQTHGKRPFHCPFENCQKSYTRKHDVRRHVNSYHSRLDKAKNTRNHQ